MGEFTEYYISNGGAYNIILLSCFMFSRGWKVALPVK